MPSCPSSGASCWVQSGSFWGRSGRGPSREEAPASWSIGGSTQPFPLGCCEQSTALSQARGVLSQRRHILALCRPPLGSERHPPVGFKKQKGTETMSGLQTSSFPNIEIMIFILFREFMSSHSLVLFFFPLFVMCLGREPSFVGALA